ncbi:hypothetical protein Xen7305DRAFT_00001680 [Xenococcus sp. PCC 7305]|nr:hypothetical protein Xen7305DRAFT_00001680 [Xenococcus sp. PCC 7305]
MSSFVDFLVSEKFQVATVSQKERQSLRET